MESPGGALVRLEMNDGFGSGGGGRGGLIEMELAEG